MAGRPIRLLLLAIVIELFAVVLALGPNLNPFALFPFVFILEVARLLSFAIGVAGLVVGLVGFRARE